MTHVLVIDDEPLLRDELQESLEFEGFDVTAASSAVEGLELCAAQLFDAIVTDLKMPQMGGLQMIETLKQKGYQSRIIVVSGHGADSNRAKAMELGAIACFPKPVDVDDIIELLEESS